MQHPILQWVRRHSLAILAALCLVMFFLMLFSSAGSPFQGRDPGDSAVSDELPHIAAAYSYLHFGDGRLNPEHPPLVKDLAGIPLLFLDLQFPSSDPAWTQDVNRQWVVGYRFLYADGNNPDQILFWARIPMILLGVSLVILVYNVAVILGGRIAGVLAAFFTAFSPTIIAHSRFVATDVPIAFFVLLSIFLYSRFLIKPSRSRLIIAGLGLGLALVTKFSSVLLVPTFLLYTLLYSLLRNSSQHGSFLSFSFLRWDFLKRFVADYLSLFLIGVVSFIVIGVVYVGHVVGMPKDVQQRLMPARLSSLAQSSLIVRAYAEYLLGVGMVYKRSIGGNTAFLLGEIRTYGWWYYFPVAFLLKVPLSIHILWILSLFTSLFLFIQHRSGSFVRYAGRRLRLFLQERPFESLALLFILLYSYLSVTSKLNIGVRHLLPLLPLIIVLASQRIAKQLETRSFQRLWFSLVGLLMLWIVSIHIVIYPYYLTYYNELIGHPRNGFHYITDSNYSWGQDMRRLVAYMDNHGIDSIYLDHSDGGLPEYYLGDRYIPLDLKKSIPPSGSWVAFDAQRYSLSPVESVNYEDYFPIETKKAQIGNSIFLFYVP